MRNTVPASFPSPPKCAQIVDLLSPRFCHSGSKQRRVPSSKMTLRIALIILLLMASLAAATNILSHELTFILPRGKEWCFGETASYEDIIDIDYQVLTT